MYTSRLVLFVAGVLLVPPAFGAQAATPAGVNSGKMETAKPAPSKVDKALRVRAEEFLADQTVGNFRKAFEMVAEESKDYYLSLSKEQLSSPKISGIAYADRFTNAVVTASVIRKANMGAAGIVEIPSTRVDTWKLVGGKWMWYHDPTANCLPSLIGVLPCDKRPGAGDPALVTALPKSTTPEAVAAAAKALSVPKAALNRQKIEFVKGQPGVEEITFHNGYPGAIRVQVGFTSNPVGFSLDANSKLLTPNGDFVVKVQYAPGPQAPDSLTLGFTVEPFGTTYLVPVRTVAASDIAQPVKP